VLKAARVPAPAAKRVAYSPTVRAGDTAIKRKLSSAARQKATQMSKHLTQANQKARKKNGDFKKGWNQSRVMKEAHRLCGHKRRK